MLKLPSDSIEELKWKYHTSGLDVWFSYWRGNIDVKNPDQAAIDKMRQVISINVGLPREVEWQGSRVRTSIFKDPVSGPVRVERLNLAGDRQSDLTVHGGVAKAVYAYPAEHYPFWREELATDLTWGAFGENLTTTGLNETSVHIGDRLRVGTAEFVVTQPRTPCYKLGLRFGRADMVRRFERSGRSGFYLAVAREGEIQAGDEIFVVARDPSGVTVARFGAANEAREPAR